MNGMFNFTKKMLSAEQNQFKYIIDTGETIPSKPDSWLTFYLQMATAGLAASIVSC